MRRALAAHLSSHQVSRVVYGAILGLAVVVALRQHPPGPGVMIATMISTAVAVGLAELYSDLLGTETRTRQRPTREQLRRALEDTVAAMVGIAFPAVFFILAAAGVLSEDNAFALAQWSGLGLISFYGFCGARLAGAGLLRALVEGLAVGLIGGALILLKAIIH